MPLVPLPPFIGGRMGHSQKDKAIKLTLEIERRSYPKVLKALPVGSKAVEQGTDAETGAVILEVEAELNFPWETIPGVLAIKPLS